jgi:MFS family permease
MKISKNVFFLSLTSFFNDVSSEIIYPLLPTFLISTLHSSVTFLGLIEGIAESTASILKLFSGYFSDKLNKRKIIAAIGYTISSLTRPLIATATYPFHVLLARFFDRVGKGIRTTPRDALIALSSYEKGKSFGFHRSMDHLGAIIGPFISILILNFFTKDLRTLFLLAFIPAVISVIIIFFFVEEKHSHIVEKKENIRINFKKFDNKFKAFLFIIFLFTLGNSSDAFLLLKAKDVGVSISLIPSLWILLHIVKSISSYPFGILSDKIGRKKVITAGWIIYSLVYFGFAFANSTYHIFILFCIYGLFFGLTEGVEKAFVSDLVPINLQGSGLGLYNFVIGVGMFPASLIMGIIWQSFGSCYAFCSGAFLALISSILLNSLITS